MPKADIGQVMAMLDPEECARVYELPNIMARESFRLQTERVENFDEMMGVCVRYYVHHFGRVLVQNVAPPDEFVRGTVWELLEHHYEGGAEAAHKAATRGLNGGIPGVLDVIRDYFLKEQENQYFDHVIMECVDVMDLEDIETLMSQYLQRYGRYLDGGHLPSAAYLVPKYRDIIKAHAQIVRSIRMRYGR